MDGIRSNNTSGPTPRNDRAALRRAAAAAAVSILLHIAVALWMRPTPQPVNDFAVDFEITHTAPRPPKVKPEPTPEPEPAPEPEPVPEPAKPAPKRTRSAALPKETPALPPADTDTDTAEVTVAALDTDTETDGGGGICLHDLYPYVDKDPNWLLYVAAAAFRGSAYEKELGNTFDSFELGRRLSAVTGMDLPGDVEALSVSTSDIFDWQRFKIAASYDIGEETLKARIQQQEKDVPGFAWRKTADGFEAAVPGEFRWSTVSSGRVIAIAHEPKTDAVRELPDNPFDESEGGGGATDTAGAAASSDPPGTDGLLPSDESPEERSTGSAERKWPRQVGCLSSSASRPKPKADGKETALTAVARKMTVPDADGHWPVAVLTTTDPRAVGLGSRMGRRLGFEIAAVRGYFTEPVRLEGYMQFSKDPEGVSKLAESWKREAERAASDPFMAVAGVTAMLKNLVLEADGNTLRFSLELKQGQVLSTLMFLQLQGRALELKLKEN